MKKATLISGLAIIFIMVWSCEPESLETQEIYRGDSFSNIEIIQPTPDKLTDTISNTLNNLDTDTGNQGNPIDDDKEDKE